jgi:hypothetical protein
VTAEREICCPSAGSDLSAYREFPLSAVTKPTRCRAGTPKAAEKFAAVRPGGPPADSRFVKAAREPSARRSGSPSGPRVAADAHGVRGTSVSRASSGSRRSPPTPPSRAGVPRWAPGCRAIDGAEVGRDRDSETRALSSSVVARGIEDEESNAIGAEHRLRARSVGRKGVVLARNEPVLGYDVVTLRPSPLPTTPPWPCESSPGACRWRRFRCSGAADRGASRQGAGRRPAREVRRSSSAESSRQRFR